MVKPITTKQEQFDFEHYVDFIVRNGVKSIHDMYENPSDAKVQAWNNICRECTANYGSYLTVTGSTCFLFSTGYLIFADAHLCKEVYFVRHTPTKRVEYKLNPDQISLLLAKGFKARYA